MISDLLPMMESSVPREVAMMGDQWVPPEPKWRFFPGMSVGAARSPAHSWCGERPMIRQPLPSSREWFYSLGVHSVVQLLTETITETKIGVSVS